MKVEYKNMEAIFRGVFCFSDKFMAEISLYNESINEYHDITVPYEEISFIGDRNNILKKELLKKFKARREQIAIVRELIGNLSVN
jgi:hypothetical protein